MCEVRCERLSLEVPSSIRLWKSIEEGVCCEEVCVIARGSDFWVVLVQGSGSRRCSYQRSCPGDCGV